MHVSIMGIVAMPVSFRGTLVLAMLLFAAPLHAQQQPPSLEQLRSEQLALRPLIEAGKGHYTNIPKEQRERILQRQGELLALIEGQQDLAAMDPDRKLAVINALNALDAAERDAEDQRQVCKRTKSTGSHRMTTVCRSVAEIRKAEENAQRDVSETVGGCSNSSAGALCN